MALSNDKTREELLAAARAIVPTLKDRAAECEQLRRVPDETIADLHDAGLWRILRPERYGGVVCEYGTMVEVIAELARGCASTSWVYMNIIAHNWMLPMWPGAAMEEIWGENPEALIGSTLIFPVGKVVPVDGGYLLSGRWPYASGIDASDWMMLGGMDPALSGDGGDGGAGPRIFIMRASELAVIDTWHVTGLAGTGSKDVACEDLFIPAHRTLDPRDARGGPTPGSETTPGAVYQLPLVTLIANLVAGTVIGIAQGAYDDFIDGVRARVSVYNRSRLADHTTVQMKIAEAGVLIDGARLLLRETWTQAQSIAAEGAVPAQRDKARWRRDAAHAVAQCVRAVDLIHGMTGGTVNYLDNHLQRRFRDIHAAAAQIHVSWDINAPEFGRVEVGLPPGNPNL